MHLAALMRPLMTITAFLTQLESTGHAVIDSDEELQLDGEWEELVQQWDTVRRPELAGDAPALSLPAAQWAAQRLYRACQAVVHREIPEEQVCAFLSVPCPVPKSAAAD